MKVDVCPEIINVESRGSVNFSDGTVSVTAITALTPGQIASFRLALPTFSYIAHVDAMVCTSHDEPQMTQVTAQLGNNGWGTGMPGMPSMQLPDPLPSDFRLVVRVTSTDGSVQESGYENFSINP